MKRFAAGITLLELMIVVAIVAILAAIAIPNYRSYVMRANRSEAMAALLRIASAQEKFYLQANTYASNAQMPGTPPAGLGVPATSDHGWYSLQIAAGAGGLASGYTATATAVAGRVQAGDGDCRTFSVNETGQRTAVNSSSVNNTANCWR